MQDFIKDMYNSNIATLERQIEIIKTNTEREIAQAKVIQDRDVIAKRFTEIDSEYAKLEDKIRQEFNNKLQDAKNSVAEAKNKFRDEIYAQVEKDINQKNDVEIYELEQLVADLKEKVNK